MWSTPNPAALGGEGGVGMLARGPGGSCGCLEWDQHGDVGLAPLICRGHRDSYISGELCKVCWGFFLKVLCSLIGFL